MALETWNGRTASQTDSDSPLDTTLMDGLRKDLDHLRQVLYGSTDPNFHTPAWGHSHDGVNSKTVVLASQTAGDYLIDSNSPERVLTTTTSYVKIKETKVGVGGTFRIKYSEHSDAEPLYVNIFRNGVAVGTERYIGGASYIEYSEDIGGWSPGDLIQVWVKKGAAVSSAYVKNLDIYVAAPVIAGGLVGY